MGRDKRLDVDLNRTRVPYDKRPTRIDPDDPPKVSRSTGCTCTMTMGDYGPIWGTKKPGCDALDH